MPSRYSDRHDGWVTGRIRARLKAGDTPEQIARHYGVGRAYVVHVATREGIAWRSEATTEISFGPSRSVQRHSGGRRYRGRASDRAERETAPSNVVGPSVKSAAWRELRETYAEDKAHARAAKVKRLHDRYGHLPPLTPEQRRIAWLKKRHALYRIGKKHGVHLV